MSTEQNLPKATGLSPLMTARFAPGMLLQDDDLQQLGQYTRDLNRLVLRSLLGFGVVCGLVVKPSKRGTCLVVTVEPGLAIDACGDVVHVPRQEEIAFDPTCHNRLPDTLWVLLCGKRKRCAPRPAQCATDEEEDAAVSSRERYAYEIRLASDPAGACGWPGKKDAKYGDLLEKEACRCGNPGLGCLATHYAGRCGCDGDCSGKKDEEDKDCDCDCECLLLARLDRDPTSQPEELKWNADHRARRFVRPVLMEDPQVRAEDDARKKAAAAAMPPAAAI